MKIKVVKTKIKDLEEIISIEKNPANEKFIFPYSFERHRRVIRSTNEFHFRIVDEKEVLLGFIILARTEKEQDSLEFRRIVVLQKGRGIGKAIIQWVKDFCFNKLNCHRLWLDVFTDNPRAIHVYESEGFKKEGIKRDCIANGNSRRSLILMSILKI